MREENKSVLHPNPKVVTIIKRAVQVFKNNYFLSKIRAAYLKLMKGSLYKRVLGSEKIKLIQKSHLNSSRKKKINPIQEISKNNILELAKELGIANFQYPHLEGLLFGDEEKLFKAILQLPWRCQHATDFPSQIVTSDEIRSNDESFRLDPKFQSLYTTKRNKQGLGNTNFTFFRVFVEGMNSDETRYGHAKFITSLDILFENGWISLHDQVSPFGEKDVSRTPQKKNIRKARASKDKATLTYRYFDKKGKLVKDHDRNISFLREIFYGPDIFRGIALSFILELRYIKKYNPEFVSNFYQNFRAADTPKKAADLVGWWIKEFYRIEGKIPVKLNLRKSLNPTQFFCHNLISHSIENSSLSFTKDSLDLTEEEWQKFRECEVNFKKSNQNPKNTERTFQLYYNALVGLIPLHAKKREPDMVLKYVKKYCASVPHSPNIECFNGEPLEIGLTILLMNNQIELEVPMQSIPTANQPTPGSILKLEFILTTEYYELLLNKKIKYSDIKNRNIKQLKTILNLYNGGYEDDDYDCSHVIDISDFFKLTDYQIKALVDRNFYLDFVRVIDSFNFKPSLIEYAKYLIEDQENPRLHNDFLRILCRLF